MGGGLLSSTIQIIWALDSESVEKPDESSKQTTSSTGSDSVSETSSTSSDIDNSNLSVSNPLSDGSITDPEK